MDEIAVRRSIESRKRSQSSTLMDRFLERSTERKPEKRSSSAMERDKDKIFIHDEA